MQMQEPERVQNETLRGELYHEGRCHSGSVGTQLHKIVGIFLLPISPTGWKSNRSGAGKMSTEA
jgi:hypothetical protein